MRKQGYRESTCYYTVRNLKRLDRKCNITNPEAVKRLLANSPWSEGGKQRITEEIDRFYKYKDTKWNKPKYEKIDLLPFIPTTQEVDALVNGLYNKRAGTFCQLLKETGCRPGEAWTTEWQHLDQTTRTIIIKPEKGSRSRQLKITNNLIARLNLLPKNSKHIFHNDNEDAWYGKSLKHFTRTFQKQRKALSLRLANPHINQISFRTLRHYKATMEYHHTKDIVHVQNLLGHRSILNTMRYVRLVNFPNEDEWTCKVAKTVDEAKTLVESGFDYVTDMEGHKLFRKRK
jgi:integrase